MQTMPGRPSLTACQGRLELHSSSRRACLALLCAFRGHACAVHARGVSPRAWRRGVERLSAWHGRLAAAAAPSLRPESAIDEMEPEPPAAGGAAAGQEGGIIGLLQGFGQVDFFGLGRSGGSGGGDVGGMYRVPEGPSDAPAAEDAGGDGGVRDGLGGMGLGTVWGTPWVGSSLFGAGGEGGFAAPWDAATPGGTRPAVEQPNTGQVRADPDTIDPVSLASLTPSPCLQTQVFRCLYLHVRVRARVCSCRHTGHSTLMISPISLPARHLPEARVASHVAASCAQMRHCRCAQLSRNLTMARTAAEASQTMSVRA